MLRHKIDTWRCHRCRLDVCVRLWHRTRGPGTFLCEFGFATPRKSDSLFGRRQTPTLGSPRPHASKQTASSTTGSCVGNNRASCSDLEESITAFSGTYVEETDEEHDGLPAAPGVSSRVGEVAFNARYCNGACYLLRRCNRLLSH